MILLDNLRYKKLKQLLDQQDSQQKRETISKLPPELAHRAFYYINTGEDLNLRNPANFNDKIHYLMLYIHGTKESHLADKFLVRDYLKKKGLANLAPKLYGIYSSANEIDFDSLPDKFVLKCNHGCGDIEFCKNKAAFNKKLAIKHLNEALSDDFATHNLEPHYHNIKRKIICEEFLPYKGNQLPIDYKFYCFNGRVECILVCSERERNLRLDYFDLNWNYLPYAKKQFRSSKNLHKPKNLNKMIEIAKKLSIGFPYVRIDLYNIDGKIYFSEMTFTPAAGKTDYNTPEALKYFGSLLKLPPKKHKPENIPLKY